MNYYYMKNIILNCVQSYGCIAGKYLLVRDPNKPQMRLYALPAGILDDGADEVPSDDDHDDVERE